jgi:hypothetical protein
MTAPGEGEAVRVDGLRDVIDARRAPAGNVAPPDRTCASSAVTGWLLP